MLVSTEDNKHVVERFDALLGQADLRALDELCTQDMVNHTLAPDRQQGLAGTREFLETQGRHPMTSQHWESMVVVAEGDVVVQFGRRAGPWAGGGGVGRFVDGKIAERWAIRDDLSVLRQLGAIDALRGSAQ